MCVLGHLDATVHLGENGVQKLVLLFSHKSSEGGTQAVELGSKCPCPLRCPLSHLSLSSPPLSCYVNQCKLTFGHTALLELIYGELCVTGGKKVPHVLQQL